jgi:YD repeat-containing protein
LTHKQRIIYPSTSKISEFLPFINVLINFLMRATAMTICRSIGVVLFLSMLAFSAGADPGTVTYTYDDLGRLIRVDYGGGIRIDYAYDAAGNLLSLTAIGVEPVVYVSADGLCGGKLRCYSTVQAAINAAQSGESVKVSAGTYPENVVMDQDKSIHLLCGYDTLFETLTSSAKINKIDHRRGTITYHEGKVEMIGP